MDASEIALLERSQVTRELVEVVVTGCAYSCCGKGWVRRDGYEQTYRGWIDNLKPPEPGPLGTELQGTFMLYSVGVGTLSYVVACRFFEVASVQALTAVTA